jgi:protocatechuate 3,4-dioxygenase beta subunit
MDRRTLIISGCALSLAAGARSLVPVREPVLGGACEGCDWVFDGLSPSLTSRARIAPTGEPGAAMTIEGVVTTSGGKPAANVVVYAYHTDAGGIYPPAANRHGRLRSWALTDAEGRYRFDTIRPGAYPGRQVPEHVHMHVIEANIGTYYIDNLEFLDDPLLASRKTDGRGGNGLWMPERRNGVWHARRDIALGKDIPNYPSS